MNQETQTQNQPEEKQEELKPITTEILSTTLNKVFIELGKKYKIPAPVLLGVIEDIKMQQFAGLVVDTTMRCFQNIQEDEEK